LADQIPKRRAAFRLTRVLFFVLVPLGWYGCGGASVETKVEKTQPLIHRAITLKGVVPIAFVSRPTPEVAQLSLWVDAGSRDGDPPQIATVAAWIAADRAGSNVEADVMPDGTEFSMQCRSQVLRRCLDQLSKALAVRAISENEVQKARIRLADTRLRAEMKDEARTADRLALNALLGGKAKAFLPLGERGDDDRVTKTSVTGFYQKNFGPSRALLVAVGDLDTSALHDATQVAFSKNPRALTKREERSLDPSSAAVDVAIGNVAAVTISALTPDLDSAVAIGHSLHLSLATISATKPLSYAFEIRGGAVLLVRLNNNKDAELTTRYAISEFIRIKSEGVEKSNIFQTESPRQEARNLGAKWCSESESAPGDRYGLGIGVLAIGGRADRPRVGSPDDAQKERLKSSLEHALEVARTIAEPELVGDIGKNNASVTTKNGAKIAVQRRVLDRIGVAVRFANGAKTEPLSLQSRTALLATLATTSCKRLSHDALTLRLSEIGATFTPRVESDFWEVVLTSPKENWRQAIDIALECALQPSLQSSDVVRARLILLEKFRKKAAAIRFASQAAALIAPAAPGFVAPWGSPESAANVSIKELTNTARESAIGERLSVAVVGDVDAEQAAKRIARRVAHLPKGSAITESRPGEANADLLAVQSADSQIWVVIAWRSDGTAVNADGPAAFVLQMRNKLGQKPGMEPVWYDSGAANWGVWAAIALRTTEEALTNLDQSVRQITQTISTNDLSKLVDDIAEQQEITTAVAIAQSGRAAEQLAQNQNNERDTKGSRNTALDVARRLLGSSARFAVFRPRRK
jgi:predicted Zn-dependent peptidase